MNEYVVTSSDIRKRLDAFLSEKNSQKSRVYFQKCIQNEKVLVNGKVEKASYKLAEGDVVTLEFLEDEPLNVVSQDIPLDILYEDQDLLVINKPRGMVVHPSNGHYDGGTLVNALLYHCKDLSSINGVVRPGIVHRIDKDTSGLLVVAKNDEAHIFLQSQLVDKTMYREYKAITEGVIPHQDVDIIAPIGKDKKDRLKQAVDVYHGKEAVTHVHVLERFANHTLVQCKLETGRTHQIRVHLQYIGNPCVGDKVYGKRKQVYTQLGQMLSAVKISFIHPRSKERITFETDVDEEFIRVLNEIRSK